MSHRMTDYVAEHCRNILVIPSTDEIPEAIFAAVSDQQHKNDFNDRGKLEEGAVARTIKRLFGTKEFKKLIEKRAEFDEAQKLAKEALDGTASNKMEAALDGKATAEADNTILQDENSKLRAEIEKLQKKAAK